MKIIDQYYTIENIWPENPIESLEDVARTCYKSEDKIKEGSAEKFIRGLVKSGHGAMIEFAGMTVRFITDRAISHELVRHRLANFAQTSQRYVNYSKDKHGGQIFVIDPVIGTTSSGNPIKLSKTDFLAHNIWAKSCADAEKNYMELLNYVPPEIARSVLPNSTQTEIVMNCNFREWLHIFNLRCSKGAHPQMRALMIPLRNEMIDKLPCIFKK